VLVLPGEFGTRNAGVTGERLLGLPVRVRGIQLGRSVDLLLDPKRGRVLGLDVLCGDERHRFLPFSTATLADGELLVPSALVLVDEEDGGFYRKRTVRLSSLRGLPVEQGERRLGRLHDIVLEPDGSVSALVVDSEEGRLEAPCAGGLQLGGGILRW
jgi:sporulation protein YlmC with PRC-barrel domain